MRANPSVSPFNDISKRDYRAIFADYDGDGIPNIDDPNPTKPGDTDTVEEVRLADSAETFIEQTRPQYEQALNQVVGGLKKLKPEATVMGRVKSFYSTVDKLLRKRLKAEIKKAKSGQSYTQGLTDMAGAMIVLQNQAELDQVVEEIKAGALGKVFEHEDKYAKPVGGYRAHHFVVLAGENKDIPVEVQVKTQRMAAIAKAAHTPYKRGVLNTKRMLELTDLAWQADRGDEEAAMELDSVLQDPESLVLQLTKRENPSSELAGLQDSFQHTVKKLALAFSTGKFPEDHRVEALQLFREHGQTIGVDFDGIFNSTSYDIEETGKNDSVPANPQSEWKRQQQQADKEAQKLLEGPLYRGEYGNDLLETEIGTYTFTDAKGVARIYAEYPNNTDGNIVASKIIEAKLSIDNPLLLGTAEDVTEYQVILDRLTKHGKNTPEEVSAVLKEIEWRMDGEYVDEPTGQSYADNHLLADHNRIIDLAKKAGYDGIIYRGTFTTAHEYLSDSEIKKMDESSSYDDTTLSVLEFRPFDKSQIKVKNVETIGDPSYQPSGDRAGEAKFESRFSDLDLQHFDPIKLSTSERRKANEAALAVLQKEDRAITESDLEVLRTYTGAGGLGYGEDRTGTERGLLNEHYTSYRVIQLIWEKLQKMGVTGGNILEPGAGVGNFAGFLPDRQNYRMLMIERSAISSRIARLLYPNQIVRHENFADSDLSLYNITGVVGNVPFGDIRIHTQRDRLAHLNPRIHDYFILKSLDALQPGGFLAVITSVGTMDKKDPSIRQAMVKRAKFVGAYRLPSTAFKDNADTLVTTDLILFQKYPDHSVEEHPDAGSELNRLFAYEELAVSVTEHDGQSYGAYYNPYYQRYPEHVLGQHVQGHDMQFLSRMGVKGQMDDETVGKVLEDGLEFPYALPEPTGFYRIPDEGVMLETTRSYHAGNIVLHDGTFYEKQRHYFKPVKVGGKDKAGEGLRARVASACRLLDKYDDFVTALARDTDQKEPLRAEFKELLGAHIDRFGIPDEDQDLRKVFRYDNRLYKLTTFVKRDPVGDELAYADIIDAESMFNGNYAADLADSEDLAEIALFGRSIGEDLTLDFYQSTYRGGTATREELIKSIEEHPDFFFDPETGRHEFRYQYLAGNVRRKLQVAEDNQLEKNIEALRSVLPQWIDAYSITVDPRHIFTYLPTKVLTEWIKDELNYRDVHIGLVKDKAELGNRFYMKLRKGGRYVSSGEETQDDWNLGWGETPFSKIITSYIQDSSFPLVFYDEDDNVLPGMTLKRAEQKGLDALIERARAKQRTHNDQMLTRVPQKFNHWVRTKATTEIREMIEQAYNYAFNAHINPPFDGSTLRVRGMSDTFYGVKDFTVYKHNRAIAEKLVWNGRGANCHDVGAGKTLASIITSQVLAQQGACRKPMFVVPGKVQEKWVEEYAMLFPDAKVLNMKMQGEDRHKELTMAQLYGWDAIFIADHAFKSLPLSPAVQREMYSGRVAYFDQMIENFDELIEEDDALSSAAKKSMARRLEKMKEEWEAKLRNVTGAKRLETDIFFDELGVDGLFFDEAHFYKNALGSAKAAKLGIAASKPSQRAEDALQKTKWLFSKVGYRNVFVLTATPVVNSPVEVWHMLNLCAPDLLEKYQIANLDNFINQFVREEEKIVKKTNGEYRTERVVAGYYNLPEMRTIIDEVMDIKSYDQLVGFYEKFPDPVTDEAGNPVLGNDGKPKVLKPKFRRPEAETSHEIIEPTEIHQLLFDDIILRANDILECMRRRGCETKDNFLVITGDGSKIATDLRVYDSSFQGVDGKYLKLGALTNKVADSYHTRENPALLAAADDIYGDFFNREGRKRLRKNPSEPPLRNQIIFCDWISVDSGKGGSYHQLIKEELSRAGVPKQEIAIINGSIIGTGPKGGDYFVSTGDDKEALKKQVQDDFNQGKYRILIGNQSIAEGMNLQRWTTDLHHMDVPYTPSQIQQRNGRGLRQGNQYEKVGIHFYLMKDSFDQYRLELVSKKQSWIDELFFGDGRETSADSDGESLQYEQMVAATNSDPRVKQFFESKAQTKVLKSRIDALLGETQRLESSLGQASQDIESRTQRLQSAVEREQALMDSELPETGQQALDSGLISIGYLDYSGEIGTIEINLTPDSKRIPRFRHSLELEVPKNNGNGRVLFNLIPDANESSRSFYNKIKWSSIKQMAGEELNTLFGWSMDEPVGSGRSLAGNKGNVIADETNFFSYYGIDIDVEKAKTSEDGSEVTYDQVKQQLGMYSMDRWLPVIRLRLADLFLALEKAWKASAQGRIDRIQAELQQSKKTLKELERVHQQTQKELSETQLALKTNQETLAKLQDVVNELVKTKFTDRSELYEELNRIAPKFGVKRTVRVRQVGFYEDSTGGQDKVRPNRSDNKPTTPAKSQPIPLKILYGEPLVYAGKVKELELVDNRGFMQRIQADSDDLAMIIDAEGTTLFVFPTNRMKLVKGAFSSEDANQMYEEFHHFPPDGYDYELFPPEGENLASAGHAERIMYESDKVIYSGDKKGSEHNYYHYFDDGLRPVFTYGDIYIITNLKIDGKGILN